MATLESKQGKKGTHVILYGTTLTGKSLLAGKLAEHFNLIWIDLENGAEVLTQLPKEWQSRIELIDLPDTRSYPIAIETMLKLVKASGPVSICDTHGKVDCLICKKENASFTTVDLSALTPQSNTIVVIDSLTQLTNSAIANITKNKPDDYKLDYDDWGNLGKLLDIVLSHIQQAKYHAVVISHEQEVETEGKKNILAPVGGTRNYSRNVARFFGHSVYAEKKNKKHVFASSTGYATNVLTGSRTNVSLENSQGEASLLQIFKPELYLNTPATTGGNTPTTSNQTATILSKLKNNPNLSKGN